MSAVPSIGSLQVRVGDDLWAKLCFEYSPQGEPMEVSVVTRGASEGRVIWSAADFDQSLARPKRGAAPAGPRPVDWLLGEALTCLHLGLGRYRRGEKLSAFRFVQVFVVDRLVELAPLLEEATSGLGAVPAGDSFAPERRFELRFPATAAALAPLMQGYERTPQSARAILALLDARFDVNPAMKAAILALCGVG